MDALLVMLKTNLRITTTAYDTRLTQLLSAAISEIVREGASIDVTQLDDANLVVMYAMWLWSQRDGMAAMPRMLRWTLNNRVMAEKASPGVG